VRLKKVTTRQSKTSPSVAATALAQAFKVKFLILQLIPIPFLYPIVLVLTKLLTVVSAYWHIGKDQKYDYRCPPVQPTKEKRLQEYRNPSEAPENSNTFPSSEVTDPGGIFSLFSRSPDTTSTISSTTGRTPSGRVPVRSTSARRNTS